MIFHDWHDTEIIPDAFAWYQYQYGGSAGQIIYDSIGDKHLQADVSNAPVLTENVLAGQPAWYFDGTKDPLLYSGDVSIKHVFILASNDDATFDGYQGLLTGETLGDVLVGQDAATKFFDLGIDNQYTKEGTDFLENNQQAPMSGAFRLLEVKNTGGISLDGIQVGQQKADTSRLWKGHFVEMILFDRVLDRDEIRRVRLYFNVKFGEFKRGLPLYFPSADITPTVGPSRFYPAPADFAKITDSWEYEDGTKDFNEVADDAPLRFEYAYPAVPKNQLPIYDEFWNQVRLINTFLFKDADDIVWTNVRIEDYNRNHEAHKRWRHDVAFVNVGYNSVGTYEGPVEIDAPDVPTGLALEVLSGTEILVTWDMPPDTEAPTAPVLLSATADSDSEVTLIWTAATDDIGVTGYEYRVDGGTWVDAGNFLTIQVDGLLPSTEYDFEVRAYDAAGNFSVASNLISETTDAGSFDPTDITGLYIWHDVGQLTGLSDNDPVATCTDYSGANRHSTAVTTERPTYKTGIVNSLPVLRFDGTNNYLTTVDISALTEGEAFIVFKLDADPPAADLQCGFWGFGNEGTGSLLPYTDGKIYDSFGTTVRKDTNISTGGGLDVGFHIYSAYSATADWACYLDDDTTPFYSTGTNTVDFGLGVGNVGFIGRNANASYKLDGDIAEFIMYDHKLTGPERASVYAYLEAKYGL